MPLETLANVKLGLGIEGDGNNGLLVQIQKAADAYVQQFCGRNFLGGSFTEFHPGNGSLVFLRNFPVAEVSEVRVDAAGEYGPDTIRPLSEFWLYAERGVLECREDFFVPRLPGWDPGPNAFPRAVRVVYTTAVDNVPDCVARASVELIGHWFRQATTHAASDQQNLLQSGETIYPWGQSGGFRIPNGVRQLLEPFRVPSFG